MAPMTTRRRLIATGIALAALGLTGCGMDVQTLQPYTPADGINVDVAGIKVRGALIVAGASGPGLLSVGIIAQNADALTGVSGAALSPDGKSEYPLAVTVPASIPLPAATLVPITDKGIVVTSPALKAGLLANIVLSFQSGQKVAMTIPVISRDEAPYRTLPPVGGASSAPASPAASATPGSTPTAGTSSTPTATATRS